jgi:tetratricopeptide (TPR) repeat protein
MARKKKGPAYKPDPFRKAGLDFLLKIVDPRENAIYILAVVVVLVLVVAWAITAYKQSSQKDLLNAIVQAYDKGDDSVEKLLRDNASQRVLATHVIQYANDKYLTAMTMDDAAKKQPLLTKAEEFFRLIVNYQPDNPLAFLAFQGTGYCREQAGDKEIALQFFQKALVAAPAEMKDKFSYDVGRILVSLSRKSDAVKYLEDATRGEKKYDRIIGDDYIWRLNAKQLLAEVKDTEKSLETPISAAPAPISAPTGQNAPKPPDEAKTK